jgi:hypothetical protein
MQILNEAKIHETWAPIIESQTGIKNKETLNWLSKYCHYHTLNESSTYQTLGGTPGMGAIAAPTFGGGASGFYTSSNQGSGDKFPSLLPLAIQVAAKTIGFEIVNVVPMSGPAGVLTYLDYVYAGGKTTTATKPEMIELSATVTIPAGALAVGTTYWAVDTSGIATFPTDMNDGTYYAIQLTYVGKSRISGNPIFRVIGTFAVTYDTDVADSKVADDTITVADVLNGDAVITTSTGSAPNQLPTQTTGGSATFVATAATASLVNALENHIHGFSGAGPTDADDWSGDLVQATEKYEPLDRGTGESTYYRVMGLKAYTKFVEATTYQVAASITTEQIQDLNRQYGIDVVAMVENALVNEISQSINKHILSRAFALGWSNNYEFYQVMGETMNFRIDNTSDLTSGLPQYLLKNGTYTTASGAGSIPINGFSVAGAGTTLFENLSTVQRRVVSKILAAGNIIASRGRRGPANFVVTNAQVATALADVAQFTFAPMANTINQNNGSLYPIGTLAGMTVYVDPNMEWNDTRVLVGRKGTDEEPGLKFMPYLMAEPIQTISEGTMSPKIAVKSRYALVEAGQLPQTMYYTFIVYLNGQSLV